MVGTHAFLVCVCVCFPPSLLLFLFVTGTFKLLEGGLVSHILAVIHPLSGRLLPAVFTVTDSATAQTYEQMFRYTPLHVCGGEVVWLTPSHRNILNVVPLWRPQVILTDMELAYDVAIRHVFPDTGHRICYFHIKQALKRWYAHCVCVRVGVVCVRLWVCIFLWVVCVCVVCVFALVCVCICFCVCVCVSFTLTQDG